MFLLSFLKDEVVEAGLDQSFLSEVARILALPADE